MILSFFVLLSLTACEKDFSSNELVFVGDSHVEYWDVQYDFPDHITYNYGVSGSGISLIKQYAHQFTGKTVIVITGTNDVDHSLTKEDYYIKDYIAAIKKLDAIETILVSIFPQGTGSGLEEKNLHILELNADIKIAAESAHITYVDVFESYLNNGVLAPAYSQDGRHLNRQGYELLTNRIRRVLK